MLIFKAASLPAFYTKNVCMQKIIVLPGLDFFFVSSNISGQEECRTSRNALGDYSDSYGVTPCPKFGSVEKHGGQDMGSWTQTFASGDANVCKCGCKRLQVGMQTFALQGLSHQTHLMLLDELAQIDEGVAHASQ